MRQRRKLGRDQMQKLLLRWQGWAEEHKLLAQVANIITRTSHYERPPAQSPAP